MKTRKRRQVLSLLLIVGLMVLSVPAMVLGKRLPTLSNSLSGHQADTPRPQARAELLPAVIIVGHEAGRRVTTARQAISAGADAVEVDVVAWHGQLYVSHGLLSGDRTPTAAPLIRLWPVDSRARIVEFDVKDRSLAARRLLIAFIASHQGAGAPQMFISSRDLATLRAFQHEAPAVFRFLSVDSRHSFDKLRSDPSSLSVIDGISIRYDLISAETVRWLHRHNLLVFVWTVNDSILAQSLLQFGVDGITTDQAGIMTALSWLERGEAHQLRRLSAHQVAQSFREGSSQIHDASLR